MPGKRPVKKALKALAEERKSSARAAGLPVVATANDELYGPWADGFLDCLRSGGSAREWCKERGLDVVGIRRWTWQKRRTDYEAAQRQAADVFAERALEVASTELRSEDVTETVLADGSTVRQVKNFDNVRRSQLASDVLMQMARVKAPEVYGVNAQKNAGADAGVAEAIAKARQRISGEKG